MHSVLVVGTGLIGTSVGLALQGSYEVLMSDSDPGRVSAAVARGAGRAWEQGDVADLAVVAVPPAVTADVLLDLQRREIASTFTHVASCQSQVQRDLERLGADVTSICGGHPLAGREVSGPGGAVASLFVGRPWVICPSPATAAPAVAAVSELAVTCGGDPRLMSGADHDRAVAWGSHLPQLAASALAATLVGAPDDAVGVSGPGLQDTTRIAASDPALWVEVLSANAGFLAPLADSLAEQMRRASDAIGVLATRPDDEEARARLRDLLARGNAGRSRVPVKRGVLDRDVVVVATRVPDQPGQLAGLLGLAADAAVNVEDVRVEHLSGRQTGVVELLVRADHEERLRAALRAAGLDVLGGRGSRGAETSR